LTLIADVYSKFDFLINVSASAALVAIVANEC